MLSHSGCHTVVVLQRLAHSCRRKGVVAQWSSNSGCHKLVGIQRLSHSCRRKGVVAQWSSNSGCHKLVGIQRLSHSGRCKVVFIQWLWYSQWSSHCGCNTVVVIAQWSSLNSCHKVVLSSSRSGRCQIEIWKTFLSCFNKKCVHCTVRWTHLVFFCRIYYQEMKWNERGIYIITVLCKSNPNEMPIHMCLTQGYRKAKNLGGDKTMWWTIIGHVRRIWD